MTFYVCFLKNLGAHVHTPIATFYVMLSKNLGECMQNSGYIFVMFYTKLFKNLGTCFHMLIISISNVRNQNFI